MFARSVNGRSINFSLTFTRMYITERGDNNKKIKKKKKLKSDPEKSSNVWNVGKTILSH